MKILEKAKAEELVKSVEHLIDAMTTTKEEKLEAKQRLSALILPGISNFAILQKELIDKELKGTRLQRNWRPIVMLAFAFVVIYSKFLAPAFGLPNSILENSFWNLLEIGMGGYVIGRSAEKITEHITQNITMPFARKEKHN